MKKVKISYWEKVSVWQRVDAMCIVEDDFNPDDFYQLRDAVTLNVDDTETDVEWSTVDTLDYDFETDFEYEELEKGNK